MNEVKETAAQLWAKYEQYTLTDIAKGHPNHKSSKELVLAIIDDLTRNSPDKNFWASVQHEIEENY